MATKICPSCGAVFNGKKCRACFYDASGEMTLRYERHSDVRTGKQKFQSGKQKSARPVLGKNMRSLAGFLLILVVIYGSVPLLRDWGQKLEAMEESRIAPEPLPNNLIVLHEEGPVSILAPRQTVTSVADVGLSLWIENKSESGVVFKHKQLTLGDVWLERSGVYMEIPGNSVQKGKLLLDEEDLALVDRNCLPELTFILEVRDQDGVLLFETDPIRLDLVDSD